MLKNNTLIILMSFFYNMQVNYVQLVIYFYFFEETINIHETILFGQVNSLRVEKLSF